MGRTLDDLTYFTRAFIMCRPWRYDHTVHPLEWRERVEEEYRDKKVLRVGVMRTDRVVDPSPACARALDLVAKALKEQGHEVFDVEPPDPYEGLVVASQLLNADGCAMFRSFMRTGEHTDPGSGQLSFYMDLPRPIKYLYYLWVKYVRRDPLWAGLLRDWRPKTAYENWKLVSKRETYKAQWHDWWRELDGGKGMDFMITPPNATPAVPHGGMKNAVSSCGYTFLFNLVSQPKSTIQTYLT
jgi:Asp-tRNA(Asn)/Glu-tRNA(Gln) amidotransferase A subunit family amidase